MAGESLSILLNGGVLLTEATAMKTLVEELREKEVEAGITLTVDPSTAYSTIFSKVDNSFCTTFDQAMVELAPNFLNSNDQPFENSLLALAEAIGDTRVVTCYADNNKTLEYEVNITRAYITQRAAMLNLFVTPAFDIYSLPVIVQSADIILPTLDYIANPTGVWESEDTTIATITNSGTITVVSEGVCEFSFTGSDPNVTGSVTAHCFLMPDVNLVTLVVDNNGKKSSNILSYNETDTGYGVTVFHPRREHDTGLGGWFLINGTMSQAATIPIAPMQNYNNILSYTHKDIEGDLLLWVEEQEGTCTIDHGRVYVEFCTLHETSGNSTEGLYEVVLRSTDQPTQLTKARLIKNDHTTITGIRIFAPEGTVFNNYKIKIGIKKWNKSNVTYNCGLLESFLLATNEYSYIATNTYFYRLVDGSFVISLGTNTKFLGNTGLITSLSHPCLQSQYGPSDIISGDVIATSGKILRLSIVTLSRDFEFGNSSGTIAFGLIYADGNKAVELNYFLQGTGYNQKTSTSFIAEQDIDTLYCTVNSQSGNITKTPTSVGLRIAINLEEVSLDDLDLESIELHNDVLMVNQGDIYVKYEPSAIIGSPIASELSWTSSDEEVATIDSNGHITIHSNGNVTFTATSVKHPEITATTSTVECYVATTDNMLLNLIKANAPKSYSQVGLTCTLNTDGTITLNGTTTASNTTYIRNVIWPLGNSKTAWDVYFPRQGLSGILLVWFEYVSGTVEGTSTMKSGTVFSEIYMMNQAGTELTALKIIRMTDLYSDASVNNFAMKSASGDTNGIRCIVFGFQWTKGTKFTNYTFRIGVKKITALAYHAGVFEQFMPAIASYYKLNPNNKTVWGRYPDGSIGGYLTESLTSLPTATGYIRVSDNIAYNSSLSNLLTGDQVGVIGHNYRFNVHLIRLVYDRISTTDFKFGIAYSDGTTAAEITIVDHNDYTADATNATLTGSSYTCDFLAEKQIDCIYQYYKNFKVKSNFEYFDVNLIDLDAYTIEAGQKVYVSSALDYNQILVNSGGTLVLSPNGVASNVIVNDGGYLVVSGGSAIDVTENGGRVNQLTGYASYSPNEISNKTLEYATVHSGTTLTSCIVNYCEVLNDGRATDLTILKEGYVKTWGYASNVTLTSNSYLKVAYGSAYNVVVNSGTQLDVAGNVYGIVENGGYVWISDYSSASQFHSFASHTLSDFEITDRPATVHSNTVMSNVVINTHNSNGLIIYESGVASDVTVSTGKLEVHSGGTAYDVTILPGYASLHSSTGAVVTYKDTYSGVFYVSDYEVVSSALTMESVVVGKDTQLSVVSGGIVSNTVAVGSGIVTVQSEGLASDTIIRSKGEMRVDAEGVTENTVVSSGGSLIIGNDGILQGSTVIKSAASADLSGSIVYDISDKSLDSPPVMLIESGAIVSIFDNAQNKVIVNEAQSRGSYALISSCAASNFTSNFTANVYNTSNTLMGTVVGTSHFTYGWNEYSVSLENSALWFNKVLYIPPVSSGHIVSSGEVLAVNNDEWYLNTTVESGGSVNISSGASMNVLTINYGGKVYIGATEPRAVTSVLLNGGCIHGYIDPILGFVQYLPNSFSEYTYGSGQSGTIFSGVTATDIIVNPNGYFKVGRGGSAVNIVENGGCVNADDPDTYCTFVANTITGSANYSAASATVHSGTIVSNYDATHGNFIIYSGGSVSNCIFSTAQVVCKSGCKVNNIQLKYSTELYVQGGAKVTNLSKTGGNFRISSGGIISNYRCIESDTHTFNELYVYPGGKLTGIVKHVDGRFICNGGTIDFDISNNYPHVTLVTGCYTRRYSDWNPVYTITTNPAGSGYYGPFVLCDDFPDDYTGSIVVCNSAGTSLGEIYPNSSATIDGIDYNLELESGLLTLTRQGRMLYVSGSDVELSSGDSYDYASVISGNLLIPDGASVKIINLEYTGYASCRYPKIVRYNGGRLGYGWPVDQPIPNTVSSINMIESYNMTLRGAQTTATDIHVNSGNVIDMYDSATLTSSIVSQGTINVNHSCNLDNVTVISGKLSVGSSAHVSNVTIETGSLSVGKDSVIDNVIISGGRVILSYPLSATNIIESDNVANTLNLNNSTCIQIISNGNPISVVNGYLSSASISSGELLLSNGASASDLNTSNANVYITSSGRVSNLNMVGGSFTVQGQDACAENVSLGGVARTDGKITQGSVTNITFGSRATISIFGTATYVSSAIISSGGYISIDSHGTIDDVMIDSGGSINIGREGSALNIAWTPGIGTLDITEGAYVTYASSIEGVYYASNNVILSSAATITSLSMIQSTYVFIMSNGVVDTINVIANDHVSIFNGGSCNNLSAAVQGADVVISSGGILTNADGKFGLTIYSGGYASGVSKNAANRGQIKVQAGGLIEDVSLSNTFWYQDYSILIISSGASLNSATINHKGYMQISSGGVATNIIENGGAVFDQNDNNVSYLSNTITLPNELTDVEQYITIHSNTHITNSNLVNKSATMYLYNSAVISGIILDGGRLVINSGGTVVSPVVSSGGKLEVLSGGTALSVVSNADAIISVEESGYITYT